MLSSLVKWSVPQKPVYVAIRAREQRLEEEQRIHAIKEAMDGVILLILRILVMM